MINNSTRAFPFPHLSQTNNLNEASDSASLTIDDWMRNVNDIQSLLMNKNEMLQQEINKLSSHQKEDRLRLGKTSATVERSSAHIMDIKHITQSIETRALNTGDDVEKLHSRIHACKKVIDTCVKMNHQEARDVSNIMEAINPMNSEPTRQWDVFTALFGDIQQQMNTLTASFLKYARFTRGVNARFTRRAVEYLVQMSLIQASYSLLARLLSGQRQKNLNFHCGRCKTFVTPAITVFFQKAGVAKFCNARNQNLRFLYIK